MSFFQDFINYLKFEKRFSNNTVVAYENDLRQFLDFLKVDFEIEDVLIVTHHQIRSWVVSLKEAESSNKTIHRKISSIKSFYKYLRKIGETSTNPIANIKLPKIEKRIPKFIKQSEIHKIRIDLKEPESDFAMIRNKMIIELMLATGIRRIELVNLLIDDYQNERIKVLGKRNKERIIPIPSAIALVLNQYLKLRSEVVLENNTNFMFVLNNGKKLYEKFVYGIVNNYLGLNTTLPQKSPHMLRHTFATQMLNNGADLSSIKELLGHSSLAATQVYTHSSIEKVKEIYKSAHPRSIKQ